MNTQDAAASTDEKWIPNKIRPGLRALLEAHDYAQNTRRTAWDFAIEIAELRGHGLNTSDLRWLVCRKYVEHAREITLAGGRAREFQRHEGLTFGERTAFVLTDTGVRAARDIADKPAGDDQGWGSELSASGCSLPDCPYRPGLASVPKWDRDRHELRLGGQLVKVFKLPSPVQETILMAFEEEQWPPKIDDPLPPHPDLVPKRRLHDAIKSLNRNQKVRLIRFMGDGTGEGIRWELIQPEATPVNCQSPEDPD